MSNSMTTENPQLIPNDPEPGSEYEEKPQDLPKSKCEFVLINGAYYCKYHEMFPCPDVPKAPTPSKVGEEEHWNCAKPYTVEGDPMCCGCYDHEGCLGKPSPKPEDWEKEERENFESWEAPLQFEVMEDYIRDAEMRLDSPEKRKVMRKHFAKLKSFIRSLLSSQRTKDLEGLLGEIEAKKLKVDEDADYGDWDNKGDIYDHGRDIGFNSALQSIQEVIKGKI